jgi:hypothetical protein
MAASLSGSYMFWKLYDVLVFDFFFFFVHTTGPLGGSPPQTVVNQYLTFHSSRCVVKNPSERASAVELMEHPFVKKQVGLLRTTKGANPDLQELYDSCIEEIMDFRETEANRQAQAGLYF